MTVSAAAVAALAQTSGLDLPPERLGPVAGELSQLLELAASIDAAELEGVEPVTSPLRWR